MRIGVPTEIKVHEYRVGLVPAAVRELVVAGHEVRCRPAPVAGIGCSDDDYRSCGRRASPPSADAIFRDSQLIVKVKEPQPSECARLRRDQVLFTYLHLAADRAQAEALIKSQCVAIAYETVTAADGSLPLLTPMSEVAGRMSVQVGAQYLQQATGGRGVLLGGVRRRRARQSGGHRRRCRRHQRHGNGAWPARRRHRHRSLDRAGCVNWIASFAAACARCSRPPTPSRGGRRCRSGDRCGAAAGRGRAQRW